jgi:hypothetical protein
LFSLLGLVGLDDDDDDDDDDEYTAVGMIVRGN